jgi:hypothetical protein
MSEVSGRRALDDLAGALPPIGLAEVLARAGLQTRMDRKYLVPAAVCTELIPRLARGHAALEIGGRRVFRYCSTYFDTPDLVTFRAHLQGRRRRFKIRTRAYLDSRECMFELKLSGVRGATEKRRAPYDIGRRTELTDEIRDFLEECLLGAYRMNAPDALGPVATTGYLRCTLVGLSVPWRVTFDAGLTCAHGALSIAADPGHVLIESKSAGPDAPMDRLLRDLGFRPLKVSKYCLAVAVLYPEARANPWHPVLRRWFGPSNSARLRSPAASDVDRPYGRSEPSVNRPRPGRRDR